MVYNAAMAGCCSGACGTGGALNDARWRRVLWIALVVNFAMFGTELVLGYAADSRSLQADALDFLADAANYAISLFVVGAVLATRAKAALVKGISLAVLGVWVMGATIYAAAFGSGPEADVMGVVGFLALVSNAGVAALLYRYRTGDANMRSVWICSRNDAIANVAVLLAAAGVFGTGTAWPDLIVATIIAGLGLWGGAQIVAHARRELTEPVEAVERPLTVVPASTQA